MTFIYNKKGNSSCLQNWNKNTFVAFKLHDMTWKCHKPSALSQEEKPSRLHNFPKWNSHRSFTSVVFRKLRRRRKKTLWFNVKLGKKPRLLTTVTLQRNNQAVRPKHLHGSRNFWPWSYKALTLETPSKNTTRTSPGKSTILTITCLSIWLHAVSAVARCCHSNNSVLGRVH